MVGQLPVRAAECHCAGEARTGPSSRSRPSACWQSSGRGTRSSRTPTWLVTASRSRPRRSRSRCMSRCRCRCGSGSRLCQSACHRRSPTTRWSRRPSIDPGKRCSGPASVRHDSRRSDWAYRSRRRRWWSWDVPQNCAVSGPAAALARASGVGPGGRSGLPCPLERPLTLPKRIGNWASAETLTGLLMTAPMNGVRRSKSQVSVATAR